jgi:hypothetical protein
MKPALLAAGALAALGLAACSRSDTAPTPAHSDVAAAMPDAAATPGAQGPATSAPHGTPPPVTTLSDTHPVTPHSAPANPPSSATPTSNATVTSGNTSP